MAKQKGRPYIAVNLPRNWEEFLDEALQDIRIQKELELKGFSKTHSGLGVWIINDFLVNNTSFRFEHLNTQLDKITIVDRKINRVVDVYVRDQGKLYCGHDCVFDCDHIKFAKQVSEVVKLFKSKGWEL
ncbi:MAG: hypothetical protein OEY22_01655 [Candidatus Bathyarchaeota archaeon]|nr:hypothetical protein [Candidatus Bathyarchaeota archaeon]